MIQTVKQSVPILLERPLPSVQEIQQVLMQGYGNTKSPVLSSLFYYAASKIDSILFKATQLQERPEVEIKKRGDMYYRYYCPNCKKQRVYSGHKYCPECGYQIKWI